jgi:uncharacterized membrane protein YqaE (UPF0057 family)
MWLFILAVFLPGIAVIMSGRVWIGIFLCLLHITIVGWIPATIIAFFLIYDQQQKKLAHPLS